MKKKAEQVSHNWMTSCRINYGLQVNRYFGDSIGLRLQTNIIRMFIYIGTKYFTPILLFHAINVD